MFDTPQRNLLSLEKARFQLEHIIRRNVQKKSKMNELTTVRFVLVRSTYFVTVVNYRLDRDIKTKSQNDDKISVEEIEEIVDKSLESMPLDSGIL